MVGSGSKGKAYTYENSCFSEVSEYAQYEGKDGGVGRDLGQLVNSIR